MASVSDGRHVRWLSSAALDSVTALPVIVRSEGRRWISSS